MYLDVRLLLNPELNEEVTVRPDGHLLRLWRAMNWRMGGQCRNSTWH